MAKFYGTIGYAIPIEKQDGLYEDTIVERKYKGFITKNTRSLEHGEGVNDNINVNNSIVIIADPYAEHNFFAIRYVEWMGSLWRVTNVEVERPRLILSIGGVYNGPKG